MKRVLVYLLPWMVVVANGQSMRPAAVHMTQFKEAPAWRLKDECWVSPNALIHWGWAYNFVDSEATIRVDSRVVKVSGKTIDSQFVLPLHQILNQLGAQGVWQAKKDVFDVYSQARMITVRDGKVQVDSTLPVQATQSNQNDPNRLVIDIKGIRMGSSCKLDLTGGARAAQYTPDSVRISILTDQRAAQSASPIARSLTFTYMPVAAVNTPKANTQAQTQTTPPPVTNEVIVNPPLNDPASGTQQPLLSTNAGPMSLSSEDATKAKIFLALPQPLLAPPQFKKTAPDEFQLVLPKAHYIAPDQPLGSPSIVSVTPVEDESALTLTVKLSRPMGVTFTNAAGGISISLMKPAVGNGRLAGKTVVVDAGHGGFDTGARSPDGGTLEKNLTLSVAKLLGDQLANEGATVIMTRQTDVFVTLTERADIANRNGADMFVSVHINSNSVNNKASGSICFFHKGNAIGEVLASCIDAQMKQVSGLPSMGVWSDGKIYQSGFSVLRNSKMPAVLLELGFINNDTDRARMKLPAYQLAVAKSIMKGLKVYLGDGKS